MLQAASIIGLLLLLMIESCVAHQNLKEELGGNKISVTLYANTIAETNGVSSVPPVFGITAYNGVYDFSTTEGIKFLSKHNIDTVGFGATLSTVLPTGEYSLSLSSLKDWFSNGNAKSMYKKTGDYYALRTRGIRKGGARPFLFIRNPLGYCNPYCQKINCWNRGGTPKFKTSDNIANFQWWIALITGYLNLALSMDPGIDIMHIWNEPDYTFWRDGRNGSYYNKFYLLTAQTIKSNWPNIKLGGPVSSTPSTDYSEPKKQSILMWYTYIRPLIDSTAKKGLLDFIDFHAYDSNMSPENLLNAIETTISYTYVKYNMYIPVAVTESNVKSVYSFNQIMKTSSSKKSYFLKRTFPVMLSTFALLKHPDKVIHRLLFDYKGTSKCTGCQFSGQSPESLVYSLLGKLSNASRIHLTIDGGQYMTSSCQCYSSASFGWQPVIGEAGMIDANVTIALLNTCDCPIVIKISFVGSSNSDIASSWAAIQNYNSVVTVTPLKWSSSSQSLTLSAFSLYLATYKFSSRYSSGLPYPFNIFSFTKSSGRTGKRFPVKLTTVRLSKTAYPTKAKYIMMPIPSEVPCNYMFSVEYDVSSVMDYQPIKVYIKLGFIGNPGSITWSSTWKCSPYYFGVSTRKWLQILSPGMYYMSELSCVPKVRSNGYVKLHFKAGNKCQSSSHKNSTSSSDSTSMGYLAFTSLVYVSETTLY